MIQLVESLLCNMFFEFVSYIKWRLTCLSDIMFMNYFKCFFRNIKTENLGLMQKDRRDFTMN